MTYDLTARRTTQPPRRFQLIRDEDETGISGTGVVVLVLHILISVAFSEDEDPLKVGVVGGLNSALILLVFWGAS